MKTEEKTDDLNYELLYNYLSEKYNEDRHLFEVTEKILSREEFYFQKTKLLELEHTLLIIRKRNG
jgi:hypothetical protein